MDRTVHRLGGTLLLLAGLAGAVGGVLQPPQPGPLAEIAELSAEWGVTQVAVGMAGMLFVMSTLFLARHFAGAAGEGWALLGTGTLFLGGAALAGIAAWETRDFSGLFAARGSGAGALADHSFSATMFLMSSMAKATSFLLPVAVAGYGVGMLKNSGWPSWLAWLGVVFGVTWLAVGLFGISLGVAASLPFVLGNV